MFFGHKVCGILAPWPEIQLTVSALEREVLTTRPPGKFLDISGFWCAHAKIPGSCQVSSGSGSPRLREKTWVWVMFWGLWTCRWYLKWREKMQTVSRGRKRARTEPKDVGKWQIVDEIKEERSEDGGKKAKRTKIRSAKWGQRTYYENIETYYGFLSRDQ